MPPLPTLHRLRSKNIEMKVFKFLLAITLLLPCVALTLTLYHAVATLGFGQGPWLQRPALWLGMGFGCWLAIFGLLSPSVRAYVISHELTHVFWALLMGAKVSGLKASARGGQVMVSKENWLITLSPYFFPFYAMLVIAIYYGLSLLADVRPFAAVFYYLLGFAWSFHLSFTWLALRQNQSDVRRHGWLFSMVVIYGMNLLMLALLVVLMSSRVTFAGCAEQFYNNCLLCWQWLDQTARELPALWRWIARRAN
ncbi:MAG: hypothetical protein A2107_01055 [Verrucomicrobia bacterium GWF2_62_7]|nr:MAG: hypothetical protein A2107_01055 [Verrucomicrobia bacterium GWF2_62_7]